MIADKKYAVLHYVGSFENGKVFDTSIQREPLEFQIGTNAVIPGFEKAVREMNVNDEREIILPPEEAYGHYDESKRRNFPLEEVRKSFEPEVGMTIGIRTDNGGQIPAQIVDITDKQVTIDVNDPIAGKTLKFKLILLEINDEPKYSDHSCSSCSCDGDHANCEEHGKS